MFSRVAIPDMLGNRYGKRLTAGVVAAGGTLALIPPSAILVIYAIIVEEPEVVLWLPRNMG